MSKVAKVLSAATVGLDSYEVEVEADIGRGLPSFTIVGLPDKAIDESKERIRSAIKNCGVHFPQHRLTINLAPADMKKEGPSFDLPMAIGILLASEQLKDIPEYRNSLFVGELALDGKLRHVNGILPIAIYAADQGYKRLYLPEVNAEEASLIKDIDIMPVNSLQGLIKHLRSEKAIWKYQRREKGEKEKEKSEKDSYDFAYIMGQEQAKRALEIAAAGNHNILLSGPPGSGKTLLARAIPSILPKMEDDEVLEVTKIYSVAGLTSNNSLALERPFRSPHHTTSNVAVVGGGQWPRPGEISLSHRGVLFLDEFPEFPRSVLEALRQPLEDGVVTISRAQGSLTFPAEFLLVAAQNPCPCGFLTDPEKNCICTPTQILRYQRKVSGPLMDRIDIHIEVPRVKYKELTATKVAEESDKVRGRVQEARVRQIARFLKEGGGIKSNAEMRSKDIKKFCKLDEEAEKLIERAVEQMKLSARSYHRILKIARTITDLEGLEEIKQPHIAEALQYRPKEKSY